MIFWLCFWSYVGLVISSCPDSMVEYEIHFETYWDRRDFPKHYPEWRPPASWSKLIGYSHNNSFLLFRKGKRASLPFQVFVESGNSDSLDLKTQGSFGVHDAFTSVPITTGVGDARIKFTVNRNHSKISCASKIKPSPDWFVGLDSFDLCPHGRWMEYVHIQAEPMDAGTDRGLTFTSPNWQSDPQEPIREITSHFPEHPAGSFYYPELDFLPPICQFTITKIDEYTLNTKFDAADSSGYSQNTVYFKHDEMKLQKRDKNPTEIIMKIINRNKNQVTYSSSENELPIKEKEIFKSKIDELPSWETNEINSNKLQKHYKSKLDVPSTTPSSTTTQLPAMNKMTTAMSTVTNFSILKHLERQQMRFRPRQRLRNVKPKEKIPTGDAMAVIDDIVRKYQKEHRRQLRKRRRGGKKKRKMHSKKIRPPRDCRVSDWSNWTGCNKTCGIGEKSRTRKMIKRPRRGGQPCPSLKETTWCGSARTCTRDYFNWSF